MTSPLRELAAEKVVLVKSPSRFSPLLSGIVRLVDGRGRTLGLVLNREALEEIEEDAAASSPRFLASLEASRKTGRVSGAEVRKKSGLA